jgi:gluconate 2-dehydrogenase alpha chain
MAFTAGLIGKQPTTKSNDVLVSQRGGDHTGGCGCQATKSARRVAVGRACGTGPGSSIEIYSRRHACSDEALPIRRMEAFLSGEGTRGAAKHWSGQTWRWAEYDPNEGKRH